MLLGVTYVRTDTYYVHNDARDNRKTAAGVACVRARQIRNAATVAFGRFRRAIVNAVAPLATTVRKYRMRVAVFSQLAPIQNDKTHERGRRRKKNNEQIR